LRGGDRLDFLISCLLLLVIGVLPYFVRSTYWRGVLVVALFYALTAMGWNLLGGYAGQFSVAPAAFVLIGMYTSALLAHYGNWSPAASSPMAMVSTGVIGLLLGWLCLRLRGPYLALTTIAFALSSVICGLAGGLYVHFIGLASPEMGLILQSALIIGMAVIGGMGTLGGPLLGAMLLQPLSEYVREFGVQHMVIFSLLMILILRFWRRGLYGSLRQVAEGAIQHGHAKAAVES
jgi:ABC-type branched-subunit amino acid transport system permease subunit